MILSKSGSLLCGKTPFFARGQGGPRAKNGALRVSALLCAFLMIIHLAFFPVRARAAAVTVATGTLAAVTTATAIVAFMNASGVFPYDETEGQAFSQWVEDNLSYLVDLYNRTALAETIIPGLTSFFGRLVNNTIVLNKASWDTLRAFVQWLQSEFSLTDNQTGSFLGTSSLGTCARLSFYSSLPSYDSFISTAYNLGTISISNAHGNPDAPSQFMYYGSAYSDNLYFGILNEGTYDMLVFVRPGLSSVSSSTPEFNYYYTLTSTYFGSVEVGNFAQYPGYYTYDGVSYGYRVARNFSQSVNVPRFALSVCTSLEQLISGVASQDFSFSSGIVADTSIISVPGELPAGSEFGGLTIPAAGVGSTPANVDTTIQDSVLGRGELEVVPVLVNVSPDISFDSSTGEITESPVMITVSDIPLLISNFSVPSLSSVFPFSVPYDVYRILSALNAEPVRPDFDVTIYNPISPSSPFEFHIGIPDDVSETVDNFMSLFRNMIFVAVFIALLMWARDMINL